MVEVIRVFFALSTRTLVFALMFVLKNRFVELPDSGDVTTTSMLLLAGLSSSDT